MLDRVLRILDFLALTVAVLIAAQADSPQLTDTSDRVRSFTRSIEFDYPNWVWNAAWTKFEQGTIGLPYLFDRGTNKEVVVEYLRATQNLIQAEQQVEKIYADPNVSDKAAASEYVRAQRDKLISRQDALGPLAEATLQSQVSDALADLGLTTEGQPIPPVLYHITSTPLALIVSPRNVIQQSANISVLPTLTLDQQINLEDEVAKSLNVSTLVVPIGGVGVYPTMVMETTDLNWTLDTVAHEWTHNYLNLRPLGINYSATPELRTMNETTASIVGGEVGNYVLKQYYPELLKTSSNPALVSLNQTNQVGDTAPFDFRAEMHTTRVIVDKLLAEGKIEEAESYMEKRRQVFWNNGYLIRKLNQAYFAFNGAYADVPGGAAGEDPVGPAVRALRAQSASLADFVNTIAWMTSFQQLQQAIKK